LTKTNWDEPPRLRHQLALLLINAGHEVFFFERPASVIGNCQTSGNGSSGLHFYKSRQLIHHKLRMVNFLHVLNAKYENHELSKRLRRLGVLTDYIVVNFNYDYYFLRHVFPNNRIITVINDDFWCRALFGYERPLRWALSGTCKCSDVVLTVSEPLKLQLGEYCRAEIFYPWAEQKYSKPVFDENRYILLFWGYINGRLNYEYIFQLAGKLMNKNSAIEIHLIGPMEKSRNIPFERLSAYHNIKLFDARKLEDINFEEVLAAFIPYIGGKKADDATTIPNKAFPMLCKGLPLLITGMPHFMKADFIFRLGTDVDEDIELIKKLHEKAELLQPAIKRFVENNSSEYR